MQETKILVVDDEKEIADLIEIYLVSDGYKVYKAYNAMEGLNILAKEDIKLTFDYMLCELSDSLSLLTYKRNEKIIENVVYLGLKQVTDSVLLGRDRKKEKRHERPI